MKQFSLVVLSSIILIVTGCGQDDECSSQFTFGYNDVISALESSPRTTGQMELTKKKALEFKTNYEGIVCRGEVKRQGASGYEIVTIDTNEKMNEIILEMNTALRK